MFDHKIIRAKTPDELLAKAGLDSCGIKILRQRPLETRLSAIEFLQLKLSLLSRETAIAVPVMLPTSKAYTGLDDELVALGERLRVLPLGWSHAKSTIEKKIVDVTLWRDQIELLTKNSEKDLHWIVYYLKEKQNGFVDHNSQKIQQVG